MTQDEIIAMLRASCDKDKVDPEQNGFWVIHTPELEAFAKLVAQHEREACAKMCDLAMLQNQEAINELDETEHIAQCFIQGAMTQLVKTSKAIRARGQA
jgi:ABC-type dipeptide/oligopeptide/nickel transport system ATPase subunit